LSVYSAKLAVALEVEAKVCFRKAKYVDVVLLAKESSSFPFVISKSVGRFHDSIWVFGKDGNGRSVIVGKRFVPHGKVVEGFRVA
jgi:hypothetical protein